MRRTSLFTRLANKKAETSLLVRKDSSFCRHSSWTPGHCEAYACNPLISMISYNVTHPVDFTQSFHTAGNIIWCPLKPGSNSIQNTPRDVISSSRAFNLRLPDTYLPYLPTIPSMPLLDCQWCRRRSSTLTCGMIHYLVMAHSVATRSTGRRIYARTHYLRLKQSVYLVLFAYVLRLCFAVEG